LYAARIDCGVKHRLPTLKHWVSLGGVVLVFSCWYSPTAGCGAASVCA
jgi:hypothetical protein